MTRLKVTVLKKSGQQINCSPGVPVSLCSTCFHSLNSSICVLNQGFISDFFWSQMPILCIVKKLWLTKKINLAHAKKKQYL